FRDVDLLVTPTTPSTAFRLGEKLSDPLAMYLEDIFTVGVNVAGLPALSLPCGPRTSMPIGMHLVAPWFREADALAVGRLFEATRT
ncbi:MAG: amidase family protein, partial [Patescibacteria group bacterium]